MTAIPLPSVGALFFKPSHKTLSSPSRDPPYLLSTYYTLGFVFDSGNTMMDKVRMLLLTELDSVAVTHLSLARTPQVCSQLSVFLGPVPL